MAIFAKARKMIWSTLITLCLCGAVMSVFLAQPGKVYAAPATAAIGVVDYDRLVNQHPDMEKANETYKSENDQAKKEFDAKAASLGDKEKQDLYLQLTQRVDKKRQELFIAIAEKVNAAVKETAEAKGLKMVVQKSFVVYGGLDITDDVLKKITGKQK